ncbi:DUF308 domain-containing protein [Mycobacterium sp. NPDC003449]
MTDTAVVTPRSADTDSWLKGYYLTRAAFSVVWVVAALAMAHSMSVVVAALLLIYPAWDAMANLADAERHGGIEHNPAQIVNSVVSGLTTAAVAVALAIGMHSVFAVFGVWAALSGLLQLATEVRRWKYAGAQWPMILSGVQSALAGGMFLVQANASEMPSISAIAPYAGFGAFYFLIAALCLVVRMPGVTEHESA